MEVVAVQQQDIANSEMMEARSQINMEAEKIRL